MTGKVLSEFLVKRILQVKWSKLLKINSMKQPELGGKIYEIRKAIEFHEI